MTTYATRGEAEKALQGAVAAVNTLFATREIRPGEYMHVPVFNIHEAEIAKALLPLLSGTHLGRLIRAHGREFISDYR